MNEYVSVEKMSKKQKREYYKQQRGVWNISPVTRIADTDKKHYTRKIKHKNGVSENE